MRTAILAKIDGINDCDLVTSNHLAAITGVLSLNDQSITALAAGDFDGRTWLVTLFLYNNSLTALPADVFSGVPSLWALFLNDNELTTLPADVFEPLTSLTDQLFLENNLGAPFAPAVVALPDDGTVPSAGGTVMLDGSDSGGAWGAYVTYSWALTHPSTGVTVVFDDPAPAGKHRTDLHPHRDWARRLIRRRRHSRNRHRQRGGGRDNGDHGHCGRRRADQPHIHVPVDSGER